MLRSAFRVDLSRVFPVNSRYAAVPKKFVVNRQRAAIFFLLQIWTQPNYQVLDDRNAQAWTLSMGLIFYLSFPYLLRRLSILPCRAVLATIGVVCVQPFAGRLSGRPSAEYRSAAWLVFVPAPLLRLPEFIFGICLALIHERGGCGSRVG